MKSTSSHLFLRLAAACLLLLLALPPALGAVAQQAYVKGSNTAFRNVLGTSVAISGDTMVVGVPGDDATLQFLLGLGNIPASHTLGAVYVFVKSGGTWTQQAYLQASNARINDFFGCSVAICGDTIVVGAMGEDSNGVGVNGDEADTSLFRAGAAYVFVRSGTAWTQQAYLKASNPGREDLFGASIAISGDTVVVGAVNERSNASGVNGNEADDSFFGAGAAYVFARSGTVWSQQAYLKASNTDRFYSFGKAVAIESNTIVVGADREWSNAAGVNGNEANRSAEDAGAAYVFVRDGTAWTQEAYLKASNTDEGDRFGAAVAISGNTVVVGANAEASRAIGVGGNQADNSAGSSGAVYVFLRSGTTWNQQAYLKASNTNAIGSFGQFFGKSVDISADTIIIGAPLESSRATGINGDQVDNSARHSGAAYVFSRNTGAWAQQAYLKASISASRDLFGSSVAILGDSLIVGAPFEDSSSTGVNSIPDTAAPDAGAAYVFQFTPTVPAAVTLAATSLTPNTAMLNSRLSAGLSPTTVRFEYSENALGPFTSITVPGTVNGSTDTFPAAVVTGLQPGTTYYFRVVGSNALGSTPGDLLSFTTPITLPILFVDGATAALTDIHASGSSFPHHFTRSGGELYFVASDAVQGTLLRRVTAGGSEIVADVNGANPKNSGYANLTDVDGKLYFTAGDGVHGTELWKLDPAGPSLVADLNPGTNSSYPSALTVINGVLYFTAENTTSGREIWRLSLAGIPVITELQPGIDGSFPEHLTRVGDRLFFSATTISTGTELWYLNDSLNAVLIDDNIVSNGGLATADGSVTIGEIKAVGDTLYFDTTAGFLSSERKIWRVLTNAGSATPAELLFTTTATPGPFGSPGFPYPAYFTLSGSTLYFTGSSPALGNTLWKVPNRLSPADLLVTLSQPRNLIDVNGTLYFSGDDGKHGEELWRTTVTGVESLGISFPNALTVVGGRLFFNATDVLYGQELWHILADGSPAMLTDASPGPNSSSTMFQMVMLGSRIFFTMDTEGEGLELWMLDSLATPRLVEGSRVSSTTGSNADTLTVFQGVLYFQAADGVHCSELWRTTNAIPTVNVLAGDTAACTGIVENALGVLGLTLSASIGSMTFNPAAGTWRWSKPNADLSDSGVITITASNSTGVLATVQFHLLVESNFLSYAAWVASYGLTGPDANPGTSLPRDGISNLLRYAFNITPSVNSPASIQPGVGNSGLPYIVRIITPSGPVLRYEHVRRRGATLIYTPKKSTDLIAWIPLTSVPTISNIDALWERIIYDESLPPSESERMFGVFEITNP